MLENVSSVNWKAAPLTARKRLSHTRGKKLRGKASGIYEPFFEKPCGLEPIRIGNGDVALLSLRDSQDEYGNVITK